MKTTDLMKDAIHNTFRNKVRTSLTVTAIFIGAFTLTLTNSIGAGVSSYIDNQVNSIGSPDIISVTKPMKTAKQAEGPQKYTPKAPDVQSQSSPIGMNVEMITKSDLTKIGSIENINSVEPTIMVSPDFIEGNNGEKFIFTPNIASSVTKPDISTGKGFTDSGNKNEVMLPPTFVKALGYNSDEQAVGQTVTIGITDYAFKQHNVEATVTGVLNKSLFGETISLNSTLTEKLSETQRTGLPADAEPTYMAAVAHMKSGLDANQISQIKSDLSALGLDGKTMADQLGSIQAVINGIIGILNAFAGIALLAAGFGIINTLLMSVQERTREIGLMKAMGMSGKKIYALFSMEAVFIGFLGSAIGSAVAIGLGSLASAGLSSTLLSDLPGLNIMLFTVPNVVTVILVVMVIAFLAGTIPAHRAAKQHPIDALRYE